MTREEILQCANQAGEQTGLCFDAGTDWLWSFARLLEERVRKQVEHERREALFKLCHRRGAYQRA